MHRENRKIESGALDIFSCLSPSQTPRRQTFCKASQLMKLRSREAKAGPAPHRYSSPKVRVDSTPFCTQHSDLDFMLLFSNSKSIWGAGEGWSTSQIQFNISYLLLLYSLSCKTGPWVGLMADKAGGRGDHARSRLSFKVKVLLWKQYPRSLFTLAQSGTKAILLPGDC